MKMALVGASGYGGYYLELINKFVDLDEHPLRAVIDPYAEASPWLGWLKEKGISIYPSLEAFYASDFAELVMLCSPIQFHREQSVMALEHGSAVLCEKPVTATVAETDEIRQAAEKSGKPFGIGFQWSFSTTMLDLKQDILDGIFGKPLRLRTHISWKRGDAYYDPRGWKGRKWDKNGNPVMDSIAMNATAHYLHNILFLLGEKMDQAAMPAYIKGGVYRARDIESYDTIFLRGDFPGGAQFLYTASHMGEVNTEPMFSYEFEKGTVTFDGGKNGEVRAVFSNGEEKSYGFPQSGEENFCKIKAMLKAAETGNAPVCGIDTVMPHLTLCEAVFNNMETVNFPAELIVREENPSGVHVQGLNAVMTAFYETGALPGEQGCAWAGPDYRIEL